MNNSDLSLAEDHISETLDLVSLFNGISTVVDYQIPKPSWKKNSCDVQNA